MFCKTLKIIAMLIALLSVGGCSSALHSDVQALPEFAQSNHYNVFVLEATTPFCLHQEFYALLHNRHGEKLLTWSVQEVDALHYVYAFPPDPDRNQNIAFAEEMKSFVEGYAKDTICSRINDFDAHFPMLDNTAE